MNRKYILSILAVCAISGCSNDSATISTIPCSSSSECEPPMACIGGACIERGGEGDGCSSDGECAGSLLCRNGVCIVGSDKGGKCDGDTSFCSDGLECLDGVCMKRIPLGNACQAEFTGEKCVAGSECVGGVCARILDEGAACDNDDKTRVCAAPTVCRDGICAGERMQECMSDEDCDGGKCLESKVCGAYVGLGEPCSETRICADGLVCDVVCVQQAELGEPCNEQDFIYCNAKKLLLCIDNVCTQYGNNVQKGESCNDMSLVCGNGLICKDGKCFEQAGENEACGDESFIACNDPSLACYKGICTPVSGECETSADCREKDSYCCVKESCGSVRNQCIPYDKDTSYDDSCKYTTKPGIFEAQVQCRWQPPAGDPYPNAVAAEMPPLVGHFGNKSGLRTSVVILSTPDRDNSNGNVLRVINPETCETLESIPGNGYVNPAWHNYPAAADLDGNGYFEILAANKSSYMQAFKWDNEAQKHTLWWTAKTASKGTPMTFDINGDGKAEVITGTVVLDGQTGETIYAGTTSSSQTYAIGIFDNDPKGIASLLTNSGVYKWDTTSKGWKNVVKFSGGSHTGYADFGTPGATAADFDFTKLDGIPEFVLSGDNKLKIFATPQTDGKYAVQEILSVGSFSQGGPVTIGDFDNDGLPEVAVASNGVFGVYDPRCKGYNNPEGSGCADKFILWERWSQDNSSGVTGSSLFDFDGDGQPEAVYGDECFVRVYEGNTGRVLFSARRSSWTSVEAPVIADIDDDGSAEILMTSDQGSNMACTTDSGSKVTNGVDPIHEGIRCIDDEDCPTSKNCNKDVGLCTCETDNDCNTQYIKNASGKDTLLEQYVCAAPIHPNLGFKYNKTGKGRAIEKSIGSRPDGWKSGDYKVCRATRKSNAFGSRDLMIYKDRLDRWVSSRNIWNQHSYNIINVMDDGRVPDNVTWWGNWILEKAGQYITGSTQQRRQYNNYRLNSQGLYGAGTVPDITGRFETESICGKSYKKYDNLPCGKDAPCSDGRVCQDGFCADMRYIISGKLCNRGTKPVSTNLPASFYFYDASKENNRGDRICTSYTQTPVGIGQCDKVGCEVTKEVFDQLTGKEVLMITNENEYGFRSTDECNYTNNNDRILINQCADDIVIVN